MSPVKSIILALVIIVLAGGCKGKKKPVLNGEDPVEVSDFIDFFQPLQVPVTINDSSMSKKDKDSLLISQQVFGQFVPDSVVSKIYGKGTRHKIYPFGKLDGKSVYTYLIAKVITADKRSLFLLTFDKNNKFFTAMEIFKPDAYVSTTQTTTIDRRYSITKTVLRKNPDGSVSEGKDVYVLSPEEKTFSLIMTDALDDKITEVVNPIDTLAKKNKISADYIVNKMNIVSIRDSKRNDRFSFFIHFDHGECNGELRGEAMIRSSNTAEYNGVGDPCNIRFTFTPTSVTLKELDGCGAHRGLRCSFDGTFPRKKEAVAKPKPKKSRH